MFLRNENDRKKEHFWRSGAPSSVGSEPGMTKARWSRRIVKSRLSTVLCPLLVGFALLGISAASAWAAEKVELSVDVSKTGAKIDRNIFGQFAEHLGHGVYEGIWVGPDSKIPNTRGIRNDVVAALKAIKVPNVRWPGGCFADEYHWRNGIGSPANGDSQSQTGAVSSSRTLSGHTNTWTSSTRLAPMRMSRSMSGQALRGKRPSGWNT